MTKKSIGLEEFNKLALTEQLNALHKDGVHIGKRIIEGRSVILFQLNDFYVEVFYRVYRKDVDKLLISDNIEMVHPYLGQIKVDGLDNQKE